MKPMVKQHVSKLSLFNPLFDIFVANLILKCYSVTKGCSTSSKDGNDMGK